MASRQIQCSAQQTSVHHFRHLGHVVRAVALRVILRAQLVQEALRCAEAHSTNATVYDFLLVDNLHGSAKEKWTRIIIHISNSSDSNCERCQPADIRAKDAQHVGWRSMWRKNGRICATNAIAYFRFRFPCGQRALVLPLLHIAHLNRIVDARMNRIEAIGAFVFLQYELNKNQLKPIIPSYDDGMMVVSHKSKH